MMNSWLVLFILVMSVMIYCHLSRLERKLAKSTYLWNEVGALQGIRIVLGIFVAITFLVLADRYAYDLYQLGSTR
ncbi:hypothetical protein D3C73_204800 [compost metagenome]